MDAEDNVVDWFFEKECTQMALGGQVALKKGVKSYFKTVNEKLKLVSRQNLT